MKCPYEFCPDKDTHEAVQVGDFYEDCSFHPMLCIESDYEDDSMTGISLVDGRVGHCSPHHCGVQKLTPQEAIQWKLKGPQTEEFKEGWGKAPNGDDSFKGEFKRWWDEDSEKMCGYLEEEWANEET